MQTRFQEPTLAELALSTPGAAAVFHRRGLDYCCRGRTAFTEACLAKGLVPAEVHAEIEAFGGSDDDVTRFAQANLRDVVDHILERYHTPLREELPRLIALSMKVDRAHARHPARPEELTVHLERILEEVLSHLAKEEQILFPMILSGRGGFASGPVAVMLREHEDHGENLTRTRALTNDLVPPEDACTTWRVLYRDLERLERDLMDHILLENSVLFPRALAEDGGTGQE